MPPMMPPTMAPVCFFGCGARFAIPMELGTSDPGRPMTIILCKMIRFCEGYQTHRIGVYAHRYCVLMKLPPRMKSVKFGSSKAWTTPVQIPPWLLTSRSGPTMKGMPWNVKDMLKSVSQGISQTCTPSTRSSNLTALSTDASNKLTLRRTSKQ